MKRLLAILPLLLWLASCSVDRYLGERDEVLQQNRYQTLMADGSQPPKEVVGALSGMKNYAKQSPNPRFLGVRWSMRLYCFPSPADSGRIANYMRQQGSAPVVYNHDATLQTARQLEQLLESKGCFNSLVSFDTTHHRRRDVRVTYHLQASPRYSIGHVDYRCESPEVERLLSQWKTDSRLRPGAYYNADDLAAERERLTANLRNEGYYLATRDNVVFYLDTANDDHTLNISVRLASPQGFRRHRLDRILFYPSGATATAATDTLAFPYTLGQRTTTYLFLDTAHLTLSPHVIARNMFLFHGQLYRDRRVEDTYNSLLALRNFKYLNIEFTPSPRSTADSALLDAHIRLIPSKRRRMALSLELNNSSAMQDIATRRGNFGLEATLSYQNKNLFRRQSGLLNVDLTSLIELPKDLRRGDDGKRLAAFELGTTATLDLPTLLPFSISPAGQRSKPHTLLSLGANYQNRPYLERALANVSFGYTWNRNRQSSHQLIPIELTYALYPYVDADFLRRITNGSASSRLRYQYSDHFILDARYTYSYTNQLLGSRQDFSYFTFSAESAGNLLYGLDQLFSFPKDNQGVSQALGVPYSQHVRLSAEYKHYFYHGQRSSFVARTLLGAGLPYSNSRGMQMPYEKSFFGGGPTTLRAWHLRCMGPGNSPASDSLRLERTGDLTLVLNLEERFPLISVVEGAIFLDIGNVWLLYPSDEMPGGQLTLSNLLPSLAVGTGVGLRANVSILTLRLDLGIPVYDPGLPPERRFTLTHPSPTLNIGIDYPF